MIKMAQKILWLALAFSLILSPTQARDIYFYITVDWEGVDFKSDILAPEDLERVKEFRKRFPHYPMVQYLNAAYYTNGSLNEKEVTERIKSVLLPEDELGLHLHPWKNLTDRLDIPFIEGPTYFGKDISPHEGAGNRLYPKGHQGGDIPLWSYPKDDIRKMIRFSVNKLNEHGLKDLTGFRAGGWQTDNKVIEVLKEEGFQTESSPVPHESVRKLYPDTPLAENVTNLWGQINNTSQPYLHRVPGHGSMLMMPNNAGLADYVDSKGMMDVLKANLKNTPENEPIHLVYGFHLETAVEYMDRLEEAIVKMEAFAKANNHKVKPATYQQVSRKIRKKLFQKVSCDKLLKSLLPK